MSLDMPQAEKAMEELIAKLSALTIDEKRSMESEYCELVFLNKNQAEWDRVLGEVLSSPVKCAKVKPGREDLQLTQAYGGIQTNQTLYKKDFGASIIIAMLWPWQDATHTTLKVAVIKK